MRIVVKIGTRSLLSAEQTLDVSLIGRIVDQIHELRRQGIAVALVSSGAVGAGRDLWHKTSNYPRFSDKVLEKQILASLGQASLIQHYNQSLARYDMLAAQLLLTRHDFRHRRHSVNVGRLLEKLLQQENLLPIINENDSLAVEELMFTDNDELSGLLAAQIGADKLIFMTDVEGVYDLSGGGRKVIPEIRIGDKEDIDLSQKGGGRGGMASKLATARRMAQIGTDTHIVSARAPKILMRVIRGEATGTLVRARRKSSPMKRWLAAGVQQTRGRIAVNKNLAEKMRESNSALSILPVGVTGVVTAFEKGDVVEIADDSGRKLGHGLARYDATTLEACIGKKNQPVFIHYNALHISEEDNS